MNKDREMGLKKHNRFTATTSPQSQVYQHCLTRSQGSDKADKPAARMHTVCTSLIPHEHNLPNRSH